MKRDFTISVYKEFLSSILSAGFKAISFEDFIKKSPSDKVYVLRHDVDRKPENALALAKIQHQYGVRGTYFWRVVSESYDADIIREVVSLGHEIGYHYEDLTLAKGNHESAIAMFEEHLELFREFYPVTTLCMHGSPFTKWDNREIWGSIDYKAYGLIGEPYFDVDFNDVLYVTDTGRSWNKTSVSVRDHVDSNERPAFRSTEQLIEYLSASNAPQRMMYNIHPHRWNEGLLPWTKELVMQNFKNQAKRILKAIRNGS